MILGIYILLIPAAFITPTLYDCILIMSAIMRVEASTIPLLVDYR